MERERRGKWEGRDGGHGKEGGTKKGTELKVGRARRREGRGLTMADRRRVGISLVLDLLWPPYRRVARKMERGKKGGRARRREGGRRRVIPK